MWRALPVHVDSWGCRLQMQLNTPVNCVSTQEPDEHMNTTRTQRRAPHHVSNLLHTRMLRCCYCKYSPARTCSVFINLTASPQVEITLMGGNALQTRHTHTHTQRKINLGDMATDTNKECYIARGRSVIWCGDWEKRRYEWRVLRLQLMNRLMWLQRVAPSAVCHICCIYYTWRAANMMISILQTAVHNRTVKNLICSIWEVKLKSDVLVFIDMHRHVLYSFQVSSEPALIYWEIQRAQLVSAGRVVWPDSLFSPEDTDTNIQVSQVDYSRGMFTRSSTRAATNNYFHYWLEPNQYFSRLILYWQTTKRCWFKCFTFPEHTAGKHAGWFQTANFQWSLLFQCIHVILDNNVYW